MADPVTVIDLDPNTLTLGEMEFLEDHCGQSFTRLMSNMAQGDVSAKLLTGLVVVTNRRTNPAFTVDDARQLSVVDVTMGDIPKGDAATGSSGAP